MRVTYVHYKRVRSDGAFGNREFFAEVELEPTDDPVAANERARATVEQAMQAERDDRRARRWPACPDAEANENPDLRIGLSEM